MKIYELQKEDLTHLGGPMGTEYVTTVWTKPFSTIQKAKDYAEKDHKSDDNREPIKWVKKGFGMWFSGDLLSHSYRICRKAVD